MIDWSRVYAPYADPYVATQGRKFDPLPKPLPWVGGPADTDRLTIEWLLRDSRADEIRLCEEAILNHVKDHWYRAEFEEGRFVHLCYPASLISFRRQYESLFKQFMVLPENATGIQMMFELQGLARERLWAAWNTMGGDGMYVAPSPDPGQDDSLDSSALALLEHQNRRPVWNMQCFRCQEPLPRGLQLWVKIQHSKLGAVK